MEQAQAIFLFEFLLSPKQTNEPHDSFHIIRIGIAGRSLMYQLWFFDTRLRGHSKHDRSNLIDGRDVQNQFGICGNLTLTLQRHEDDWSCRREAFVPSGEGITLRGLN